MSTHIWNVGRVQGAAFPPRINVMTNTGLNMFFIVVTNHGGGQVNVYRGAELQFTLVANQSRGFASDRDVDIELVPGGLAGATGNFSIASY